MPTPCKNRAVCVGLGVKQLNVVLRVGHGSGPSTVRVGLGWVGSRFFLT